MSNLKHEDPKPEECPTAPVVNAASSHERVTLLAQALRCMDECVSITDASDHLLFVNEAFIRTYGYGEDELLGQHVSKLRGDPRLEGGVGQILKETIGGGWRGELWNQRKDGTEFPISLSTAVVRDEDGTPIALIGVARDLTETRRAEEEVLFKNALLEAQSETTLDGILVVDEAERVILSNRQFARMWRLPDQTLNGKDDRLLLQRVAAQIQNFDSFLEHVQYLYLHREEKTRDEIALKDGRTFERYSAPLIDSKERYWGRIWYFRDITERKQAEAEAEKAKEAAEAASRAKSEFLANMSHEIRTPMNGILGMTELALDTGLRPEQRDYLNMVKCSAESLLRILNDILDFSKIEASRLELDCTAFELERTVEEAARSFAIQAEQKAVELICDVRPELPERVYGDPIRLRQIVVNLLGNAIKFTERGEVVVRVEKESEDESGILLHFVVSDTGIGIPEDKHKLIFEAFSQADGSTSRKFGGTGLGLAISKVLVEMMNGRIWLDSEEGGGSRFHFTARFGKAEASDSVKPKSAAELCGISVLVVDDNATNRCFLREVLAGWGMQPDVAEDGASALVRLCQAADNGSPFPLIVTDCRMPLMDGFALVERIRSEPKLSSPTVMMLSSGHLRDDAPRCRQLDVAAYVLKPVRPLELQDAVLIALGKRPASLPAPAPATPHKAGASLRILVAEDNPTNRQLMVRLLEKQGHAVRVAGNGREVLDELDRDRGHIDLILMDVQMPEMDGLEATAAIRARERQTGGHVPIVALTAHAMKADRERCLAAGMDGYLSKPVRPQELLDTIARTAGAEPA